MDEGQATTILDEKGKQLLEGYYAEADSAPGILNVVLNFSISAGASDILFEPRADFGYVRARIDGIMYLVTKIPIDHYSAVVSRLKIMAALDITTHSESQEGKIAYEYEGRPIEFRIAVSLVVSGEFMAIRLHDSNTAVFPLEQLGIQQNNLLALQKLLKYKSGLILTCGPTGSGKTSTLYSCLQLLNHGETNIISVEDPVEYLLPGINQLQVDKEHGMTFADGLRIILRLNPDIIFVGEIRDAETAHIGIESALTGHLVLSTIHANSAIGAIFRLLDLDVEKFFINTALIGVLSQRLVRRVCPHCVAEAAPTPEEAQFYQQVTGKPLTSEAVGKGCAECAMTGYKGRIGIFEVLIIDDTVRTMIGRNASEEQIKTAIAHTSFTSLLVDGMSKVDQKLTRVKEVMSNVYVTG